MAISKPPINDKFLVTAKNWKGTKWKTTVVGTKKIKSKEQANFIFFVKIRRTLPEINNNIAANNSSDERGSGNPLLVIYSAWALKFVIFPGIAFIKIALRNNLPRKFKE